MTNINCDAYDGHSFSTYIKSTANEKTEKSKLRWKDKKLPTNLQGSSFKELLVLKQRA